MSQARRKGQTAMAYARKWIALRWPGAAVHEARPTIVWIPKNGRREPIATSHDIYSVFDAIVQPSQLQAVYVQVTTQNESVSTAAARQRKIERWLDVHQMHGRQSFCIYVVSYVARQHLRIYAYSFASEKWIEQTPVPLKALNVMPTKASSSPSRTSPSASRSAPAPSPNGATATPDPRT